MSGKHLPSQPHYKAWRKRKASNKKKRAQELIRVTRENTPCVDCGKKFHFSAMEFDHIIPISQSHKKRIKSAQIQTVPKAKAFISETEIRCANCHAIRGWQEGHQAAIRPLNLGGGLHHA